MIFIKINFTRHSFEKLLEIEKIITIFYMELSKSFCYEGERHDFWEMVYIDKGEMLCTADKNQFTLKSGEMTFHRPGEFHNLSGDGRSAPNVSIITFETASPLMKNFEGKIFKLSSEEKNMLSLLFEEGLSCYRLVDETNPLLQELKKLEDAPLGSSQMTKNLLEAFLIMLCRNTDVVTKKMRRSYKIGDALVPYNIKEILDFLEENIYGKITVSDIAKKLSKSESSIKQLFSSYQKNGIIKYYNSLKIEEAKKLIRSGKYNIAEVSSMLSFDTPQYFSKCFKKETNMTPSQYKLSIKK